MNIFRIFRRKRMDVPSIDGKIYDHGCFICITINLPLNRNIQNEIVGLADTGADRTCINYETLHKLNLPIVDRDTVKGFGSNQKIPSLICKCDITLGRALYFPDQEVTVVQEMPDQLECILGRDVLNQCLFTYDGPNRKYTIIDLRK